MGRALGAGEDQRAKFLTLEVFADEVANVLTGRAKTSGIRLLINKGF